MRVEDLGQYGRRVLLIGTGEVELVAIGASGPLRKHAVVESPQAFELAAADHRLSDGQKAGIVKSPDLVGIQHHDLYAVMASTSGDLDIGIAPLAVTNTCCSSLTPSLAPTSPMKLSTHTTMFSSNNP